MFFNHKLFILVFSCAQVQAVIIANFSVSFEYVATDELVRLQTAIEDVGYIDTMPVILLQISSSDAPPAPINMTAIALSNSKIEVSWSAVVLPPHSNFSIIGYTVFYKPYIDDAAPWLRLATPKNYTRLVIDNLKSFTTYTTRVVAFHYGGNGIASKFYDEKTMEGVPSERPGNLSCVTIDSSTIFLEWIPISASAWNGIPFEYKLSYRKFGSIGQYKEVSFSSYINFGKVYNLSSFQRYEFLFTAATKTGKGPKAWCTPKTIEGVPLVSPIITYWELDPVKQNEAFLTWKEIPDSQVDGVLTGYRIKYGVSNDGTTTYAFPVYKSIEVGPFTTSVTIPNIPIAVILSVEVAAMTRMGTGKESDPTYIETCKCPKNIYASWFDNSPYVQKMGNGKTSGIFPIYLDKMVLELCSGCYGLKRGNVDKPSTLYWDRSKDGKSAERESESELKSMVENNFHFHVAMFGREEIENFRDGYKFVAIVKNPGIAFIIRDPLAELDKTSAIMKSLLSCWPAVIIIFLFSLIAGIVIWILDCSSNSADFPNKSFFEGIYHGAYWAFISMSTVGYGDKTPKSYAARFVTILWMLMGPIINGVVIGAITTSLTTIRLEEETILYGTKVGAINGSFEFNLGIRRNAIMNGTDKDFRTTKQLLEALEYSDVDGVLMDSLAAADLYDDIIRKKLKISKLIDERSGWGVILSSDFLKLENEVRSYVSTHVEEMESLVKNYTNGKLMVKAVAPAELDTGIVDPKSRIFQEVVMTCAIIIVACILMGTVYDFFILKARKNKVQPAHKSYHDSLKNETSEVIFNFKEHITNMLANISKIHESEIKKLFWKKGYSYGIDGWLRQKTNNEAMLKKDIRYQEIMLQDLAKHSLMNFKLEKKKESALKKESAVYKTLED